MNGGNHDVNARSVVSVDLSTTMSPTVKPSTYVYLRTFAGSLGEGALQVTDKFYSDGSSVYSHSGREVESTYQLVSIIEKIRR